MPDPPKDIGRELTLLEAELKRLETEYSMFFAGRLQRPPWETRSRVDGMVRRLDRAHIANYAERFRFSTLQSRFMTFIDLWDRGLRAREEGRPGPFAQPRSAEPPPPPKPQDRIVHVATFSDPGQEMDKLQDLYARLVEARREVGQEPIPFQRFADLITTQVTSLKDQGSHEVAFRVAMKDGKVNFTARALRGIKNNQP